ncbi:hypothetical protein MRX96_059092 [Rhipicephalus microplus]
MAGPICGLATGPPPWESALLVGMFLEASVTLRRGRNRQHECRSLSRSSMYAANQVPDGQGNRNRALLHRWRLDILGLPEVQQEVLQAHFLDAGERHRKLWVTNFQGNCIVLVDDARSR